MHRPVLCRAGELTLDETVSINTYRALTPSASHVLLCAAARPNRTNSLLAFIFGINAVFRKELDQLSVALHRFNVLKILVIKK